MSNLQVEVVISVADNLRRVLQGATKCDRIRNSEFAAHVEPQVKRKGLQRNKRGRSNACTERAMATSFAIETGSELQCNPR